MSEKEKAVRISDTVWEMPLDYKEGMQVPARIFATEKLFDEMDEGVIDQITNVAKLPGIVQYAFCMPDGHWGYGFPIGGVAAFDTETGVISPGGIGFDINCGMRLVATSLTHEEIEPHLERLVNQLFKRIPAGVGGKGFVNISKDEFRDVIERGAEWCLERGMADPDDLDKTEERGCMNGADAAKVSLKAVDRGYNQIGTLGSGNHYLEIQVVKPENIKNKELAEIFGLTIPNQVVIMLHTGSRGFGHQVATDYLKRFLSVMGPKYNLKVKDRELSCAPFNSPEGQDYFAAMKCAVNHSFVNRQVILHRIREVFSDVFGKSPDSLGIKQVYDVTHNTAKLETHKIDGREMELLIHRKGATRAFGPGMEDIPESYRNAGQPVIIGGSMETGSYLLAGVKTGDRSFYTTAHGSGRLMGRRQAKKQFHGKTVREEMLKKGIYVAAASDSGLAEEAGGAYKSIDNVVSATDEAGISTPVAKLVPIGNMKG
jgi:tRNA-splicing ligase RtcB (3'-phosphate/5'-hydroxy nucleic acid ligase)